MCAAHWQVAALEPAGSAAPPHWRCSAPRRTPPWGLVLATGLPRLLDAVRPAQATSPFLAWSPPWLTCSPSQGPSPPSSPQALSRPPETEAQEDLTLLGGRTSCPGGTGSQSEELFLWQLQWE